MFFFFQAEDGIRDIGVTGVQTCALPIFSSISNGIIRIIDSLGKNQIFSYEFNEGLKLETAVVVAEIYRHNGQWKLNPVGNGFNGGLEALCENYGIKVQ